MKDIGNTFGVSANYIKRSRRDNLETLREGYRVRTSSYKSNELTIDYFNKFPLWSSKRSDYSD